MFTIKTWSICALALALLAVPGFSADAVPAKFYKLDFVVKEVEGTKVLNARSYSMTVSEDKLNEHSMIRAGSKVPYSTNADGSQYSYLDLGVSIDCYHVTEMHDTMSLVIAADISSIVQESAPTSAVMRQPVIRQNRWNSGVIVPLKKPTVVFSSDDLTTKRQMQVELTATPIL
jgi:hypothetical protein